MSVHMKRLGRPALVAVAVGILLAAVHTRSVSAQAAATNVPVRDLSLEQLSQLFVVSVTKEPESVSRTAAAIYVITQEDIQRSGATSLPDALRLVPGIDVARIDTSRNWVVGIRGFGDQFSKSVLVLIDGRAAYTPLWAGVHWPIHDVLLEDVDRIEVIRGPGGTIWGANAQNGVINIITKSARETHGVYVSGLTGNVDHGIGGVRIGGAVGGVDYRVYGKGIRRAPQFHTDARPFDSWASGQAGFRLDWRNAGRDELTVQGDAYKAELGESVRVTTFAPPSSFLVDDPVDLNGANLRANWRRSLSGASDVSVQLYVDRTYRLGTDFGERRLTFDADAIHRWRMSSRHEVTWGLGARTSPSTLIPTYGFSDFQPREHTFNVLSAFAQDALTVVPDRLSLTGGLKLERNTYTGVELQPSARAMWTPSGRHTVWAAVTRAVRTPSRVDEDIAVAILAATNPLIYGVISGNRALEPETVVGTEAGYRALLRPSVYLDVSTFTNRYDNLVDLGPPTTGMRTTEGVTYTALTFPWINGNQGLTRGVEIAPRWQVSPRLRLTGSYSFLDISLDAKRANTSPVTLPALEGTTPRHRLVVQSFFSPGKGVTIDPAYRYVSARRSPVIEAYHTLDIHLGVPLGRGVELAVVGQNLLEPHHAEWARDPGPAVEIRRAAYASVTWRR